MTMRDDAVSNAMSVLMMIATVLGVTSAVFVHTVFHADNGPAKNIALEGAAPLTDSRTKDMRVLNVTGNLTWGSITVELDGSTLRYDGGDSGATGYCVAPTGGSCIQKDDWTPFKLAAQNGQHVYIHGGSLLGKKVVVYVDSKQIWSGYVNA